MAIRVVIFAGSSTRNAPQDSRNCHGSAKSGHVKHRSYWMQAQLAQLIVDITEPQRGQRDELAEAQVVPQLEHVQQPLTAVVVPHT